MVGELIYQKHKHQQDANHEVQNCEIWLFPKEKAAALLEHFFASRILWRWG